MYPDYDDKEGEDADQAGERGSKAEEEEGPGAVERELDEPEPKSEAGGGGIAALLPKPPGDDGHHGVEKRPGGAEEPAGRSPGGFIQSGIPSRHAGGGDCAPGGGDQGGEQNKPKECGPGAEGRHRAIIFRPARVARPENFPERG